MAGRHLALCLLLGLAMVVVSSHGQCEIPAWPISSHDDLGTNPLEESKGKVLLVAKVAAHYHVALEQVMKLKQLKSRLKESGYPNLAMMLVNDGDTLSQQEASTLTEASNLPIYQDTSDGVISTQVFGTNHSDVIVYDRCGQRAAVIPQSYIQLGHDDTITGKILQLVHDGRHSCHCNMDTPTHRQTHRHIQSRRRRDLDSQNDQGLSEVQVSNIEAQGGGGGLRSWFSNLFSYSSRTGQQSPSNGRSTDSENSESVDTTLRGSPITLRYTGSRCLPGDHL